MCILNWHSISYYRFIKHDQKKRGGVQLSFNCFLYNTTIIKFPSLNITLPRSKKKRHIKYKSILLNKFNLFEHLKYIV